MWSAQMQHSSNKYDHSRNFVKHKKFKHETPTDVVDRWWCQEKDVLICWRLIPLGHEWVKCVLCDILIFFGDNIKLFLTYENSLGFVYHLLLNYKYKTGLSGKEERRLLFVNLNTPPPHPFVENWVFLFGSTSRFVNVYLQPFISQFEGTVYSSNKNCVLKLAI